MTTTDVAGLIAQAEKKRKAQDEAAKKAKLPLAPGQYVDNVINAFGLDKTLPKGFVDVVYNKDGTVAGYVKNGQIVPPIGPNDSKPQSKVIPQPEGVNFQKAQDLQKQAEKQYADFKAKLAMYSSPSYNSLTSISKSELEASGKKYQATLTAIQNAYQKSGLVKGEISIDPTGKLSAGTTYTDPVTKTTQTIGADGKTTPVTIPTNPASNPVAQSTPTTLAQGRVGGAGAVPQDASTASTDPKAGVGGSVNNSGGKNPSTTTIPPVSDAQILADMKVNAPWNYALYTSPQATDAQRKQLLIWGHMSQQGHTPTPEEVAAATYSWPQTQLWTANQNAKFQESFTQPGQYKDELATAQRQIADLIKQNGLNPDQATIDKAVTESFLQGWGKDDPRILEQLTKGSTLNTTNPTGAVATALDSFKQIAQQYAIPLPKDPAQLDTFIKNAVGPNGTVDDFTNYAKSIAKAQFPWMAAAIDKGVQPSAYLTPFATNIANTLDIPAASIDWQDPKYSSLLTKADGTPATFADAIAKVKTDPQYRYDYTSQAKSDAYNLATSIKQQFGYEA